MTGINCINLAQVLKPYIRLLDPNTSRRLKDRRSRILSFIGWLATQETEFNQQRIPEYQDYLRTKKHLKPSSIRVHLASVRSWLREVCNDQRFLDELSARIQDNPLLAEDGDTNTVTIYQVAEAITNSITPDMLLPANDREILDGFCPTDPQVQDLLDQIDIATLRGLRDAAIIANMAFGGVRQIEICELDVDSVVSPADKSPTWGLRIPDKPGCTPREIPYAGFEPIHARNQEWIVDAKIESGPLFRGFYRGYKKRRSERLSPRSVEHILRSYPVVIDGQPYVLKPLELRRFAARQLVASGRSIETVRQLLGVAQAQTVLSYLGREFPWESPENEPIELNLDDLEGYD